MSPTANATKEVVMAYSITPHWGGFDVDFLDRLVADTGMSNEEVLEEVKGATTAEGLFDIQHHIYVCMSLIVNRFMNTIVGRVGVSPDELPEPNISLNYLCSVYDSVYNDYDLTNLEGEVDRFVEEQLGRELLDG